MRGSYRALLVGADAESFEDISKRLDQIADQVLAAMGVSRADMTWDPLAFARDPAGYSRRMSLVQATKEQSPIYPLWSSRVSPMLVDWHTNYYPTRGSLTSGQYISILELWKANVAKLDQEVRAKLKRAPSPPARTPSPIVAPPVAPPPPPAAGPLPPSSPRAPQPARPLTPPRTSAPGPAPGPAFEMLPLALGAGVVAVLAGLAIVASNR